MRTFTLAEAARLVGTSRGTLYRYIKRGRLRYEGAGGPGKSGVITEEVLKQAGFSVPPEVEHLARLPDVRGTSPATLPDTFPDVSRLQALEQRLAHLERYTERLERQFDRALELLTLIAGQQGSAPQKAVSAPPVSLPQPPKGPPLSPVRQQIMTLVQGYPEGLSPIEVRRLLTSEKDLGNTMKAMARDGLLRRVTTGRYTRV
jgi:excisionase family DNA binding protein